MSQVSERPPVHVPPEPLGDPLSGPKPVTDRGPLARALSPLARRSDGLLKLLALALTPLVVLIFLMKFAADISIGPFTGERPFLGSYESYHGHMTQDSVYAPRFAAIQGVYYVARGIEVFTGVPAHDIRLHPLRLAAALVSTLSIWAAAAPVLLHRAGRWDWKTFYAGYLALACLSFYVYMPYDLTSLAFISPALYLLLEKKSRFGVLALLLVGGLFRESVLHVAWFAVATLAIPSLSVGLGWAATYVAAFAAEWWVLRRVIWHATTANGPLDTLIANLTSPTAWVVVALILCLAGLALVVIASRVSRATGFRRLPPLEAFFLIQVAMVPIWLLFYSCNGGNWSEFRMQLPALLPLLYAVAYRPPTVTGRELLGPE